MTPLRILELRTTYGDGGGPDKTILLSAQKHDPARYQVTCVYLRGANDQAFSIGRRARSLGIRYQEILEQGPIDLRAWRALAKTIRAHRPHVVHAHDYKTDLLGLLLHPAYPRAALLATAHGWTQDNPRMNLYNQLDRRVLRRYHHVLAVSEATRAHLLKARVPEPRISVLHNGIDTERWCPGEQRTASRQLKQRHRLPPSARLIGFFGRLSPEKDVPTALEVARKVIKTTRDAHVLIMGEGSERETLENQIHQAGLGQRIHSLGFQPLGPEVYQALEAYYMTSLSEGLPNTLLEAMACGIPSVATAVGGIPELVGTSGGVLLTETGDVQGLSLKLRGILEDAEGAAVQGRQARQRILDSFCFTNRLRRIEAVYQRLAATRTGPQEAP